ncbi:hypothetical protein N658DRAFT_412200, partial [Parathielavia hyrcaniae]
DRQFLEYRTLSEYLRNPLRAPSEPGSHIIVWAESPGWLRCHHKVFPAFWQCNGCPPNRRSRAWSMTTMHASALDYRPSCSNCATSVTSQAVLVNTQKESIMTFGGENLMPSRVELSFMWCCRYRGLRWVGSGQIRGTRCAHCVGFQASRCPECVWCNKFLEPTKFADGD